MQLPPDANNDVDKQDWSPIFHHFGTKAHDHQSLSSDYIKDIIEDREGNIYGLPQVTV